MHFYMYVLISHTKIRKIKRKGKKAGKTTCLFWKGKNEKNKFRFTITFEYRQ